MSRRGARPGSVACRARTTPAARGMNGGGRDETGQLHGTTECRASSVRAICTHTKGFDLCQNELVFVSATRDASTLFSLSRSLSLSLSLVRTPPPAPCACRLRRALTRIIFTAYHRLNIDLRMVSGSVCERPPRLFYPSPFSLFRALPPSRLRLSFSFLFARRVVASYTPFSRSTDFLASRVR